MSTNHLCGETRHHMGELKHVYVAINAVTAAMVREGISKGRRNTQQGYDFRGVDDVYAALGPVLAREKLCMLPRVIDRNFIERATKTGSISTYTTLTVEFDLVSAVDGSMHTIRTAGEAMDTADKSTNKAMSAAFKYACFLAFQIPTEGDNDADAHHHEPRPRTLESQLAASVELGEWEKLAHARLLSAASMGDLQESWTVTRDEGKRKGASDGTMRRLADAKDQMKAKLSAPRNGAQAAP